MICKFCGQETENGNEICNTCAAKQKRPKVGFSLSGLLKPAAPKVAQQEEQRVAPLQTQIQEQVQMQEQVQEQIPQVQEQSKPVSFIPQPQVAKRPVANIPQPQNNQAQGQIQEQQVQEQPRPIAAIPRPQAPQNPVTTIPRPQAPVKPVSAIPNSPVSISSNVKNEPFKASDTAQPMAVKSKAARAQIAQASGTEQKEVEKKVFSSDVTGYGDEELEISVLSGILKDSFVLESLKGKGLMAGLFSTRFTRSIYQGILSLREESPDLSSLDRIVLRNKMKQMNLLDSTIQNLIDRVIAEYPPSVDQALHYLELMKDQALKRKLKEVSQDISRYIDKPEEHQNYTIETFTNKVIHDVRNIQKARNTKRINLVKEEMRDIMNDMERREQEGEIDIIGYSFEPMHYLCQAVSGFRKGFMYAIAGAPRRGKTTFTLELATRVATLNHIPVLFFTYEQTKKNLTYRLLAKESRLNPDTLQRKRIYSDVISDAKFAGGWKKMQDYMDYFYIIEATKEDTVDRIRSYAYNAMQDFNTEDIMIFVDYIQKMPLSRNYNDEKFKVEEISTELKALSIELNNPIMTISSLSKEGCLIDATESEERPTMYHCKGSGDLEYDLDCAMIQAKDWGDTKELKEQMQQRAEQLGKDSTRVPKVDVVNLYLDKNRDAPEGIFSVIQYLFFIEDNKFIELGPKYEDDRYRFGKIEELIDKLIAQNYIVFFDRPKDTGYNKGRVSIKLKNF